MDLEAIALALLFPTLMGVAVGLPFWIKRRTMLGNLIGSGLITGAMIVLIWQGYGAFVGEQEACAAAAACGILSIDDIFSKFLGFVAIGWLDVLIMLVLGGVVEQQVKKRSTNREWW